MQLGSYLKATRQQQKLRQRDVAQLVGISEQALRNIEQGITPSPRFFVVVAVAQVLGLSLDGMLGALDLPTIQRPYIRHPAHFSERAQRVSP